MNFKAKNMLAIALLLSVTAVFASGDAVDRETTSKALSHLFPDFHAKTKNCILSTVELWRTFLSGVWKITQPELQKLGTYIKGNFFGDLANTHRGYTARNANVDIAKSIGAKAAAAFILYDIGYWFQKMREQIYGYDETRGYFASAFSDYSNQRNNYSTTGYVKREGYLNPSLKNVLRATVITSLVV